MMTYTIDLVKNEIESTTTVTVCTATVKFYNESELVLTAVTFVVGDNAAVMEYVKYTYLPDLKINCPELANLELPEVPNDTTADIEG